MNQPIRYFKQGQEVWKFERGFPPKMRNPLHHRWIEGAATGLEEFLETHPNAFEVTASTGEEIEKAHETEGSIGLW
jgi:hypothetical protein